MSESNRTDIEQKIGSEVAQFVYKVPKENHDAMMQLNKQFVSIMRKYGATHLVLQLNSTEAPMEGITNISKTLSVNQDDEVWLELIFYRDRKHKDEVTLKCEMRKAWHHFFNSLWIYWPQDPASSWGSLADSRSKLYSDSYWMSSSTIFLLALW